MPRICIATLSVTDQIPINRMDKLYPVIIHWSSILQKKELLIQLHALTSKTCSKTKCKKCTNVGLNLY